VLPGPPQRAFNDNKDKLSLSAAARKSDPLAHLHQTIQRIMGSAPEEWTADYGQCIDLSAKWRSALKFAGIETQLVIVDPSVGSASTMTLDGKLAHGKTHGFLVFQHDGQEYIMDPTVRQFFRGGGGVPAIFIGTRDDAAVMFTREQGRLQVDIGADRHEGRYDPLAFTELVYGLGAYRALRVPIGD
jgi:hypothetical protein